MTRFTLSLVVSVVLAAVPGRAQMALPLVEDVRWASTYQEGLRLLKGLEAVKAPLPAETVRALRALLVEKPDDPEAAALAVQKLLDAHCLVGVSINPESRVKAARGPARIDLGKDRVTFVLVKVHNEAGVREPLAVRGPGLIEKGQATAGRWLDGAVVEGKLTGQRLQYVVLRLTPREAGKREATLQFDVGQGTQDLGFRAEIPILFTVREP